MAPGNAVLGNLQDAWSQSLDPVQVRNRNFFCPYPILCVFPV